VPPTRYPDRPEAVAREAPWQWRLHLRLTSISPSRGAGSAGEWPQGFVQTFLATLEH
jgi:hypothetical protein